MSTPPTKRIPAGAVTPNGDQTNSEVGHHVTDSIQQNEQIPLLNTMNPRGRRIATSYYESGVLAGIAMGRQQAEEEMAELWHRAHQVVQHVARQPDYAVLAEARGDYARATRQRQLLKARGIAA